MSNQVRTLPYLGILVGIEASPNNGGSTEIRGTGLPTDSTFWPRVLNRNNAPPDRRRALPWVIVGAVGGENGALAGRGRKCHNIFERTLCGVATHVQLEIIILLNN